MTHPFYKLSIVAMTTLTPITGLLAGSNAKDDAKSPVKKEKKKSSGDWCSWLSSKPGTLYKNKKNPYIQELRFFGRFQWQYAYVDGRGSDGAGTRAFSYDTEEIRRLRVGTQIKFLNYFTASANVNLSNDLSPVGGPRQLDYVNLYSSTLDMDVRKAFDLKFIDEMELRVGKEKISITNERLISSRYIKTIERSSLSNYVAPPSSTGVYLSVEKGKWQFDASIFSGDFEREFTKFDNDYFYTLHVGRRFKKSDFFDKSRIDLRMILNGDEANNATKSIYSIGAFNPKWVVTLSTLSKKDRFELLTDLVFGDNGTDFDLTNKNNPKNNPEREGTFWGFVILPSYWIIEDKLESVFRYQYAQASKPEGFRIYARYSRAAGKVGDFSGPNDLSNGRGDRHHSAYLGLNYYLCGNNAKIMAGVEYDDLNSGKQDVYTGTTIWTAFRMYF